MPATVKPKRRRLQFSVSALLLAVAALSVWLAKISSEARLQKQVVERIRELNGEVFYDYQLMSNGDFDRIVEPPGPDWLRRIVGNEYFTNVVCVKCDSPEFSDADMVMVAQLPKLTTLEVYQPGITTGGLESLEGSKSLRSLALGGANIDDDILQKLSRLTELRSLTLNRTSVDDYGTTFLSRLSRLESLAICESRIGDAGLRNLISLEKLKSLTLVSTDISDGTLARINGMTRIESIDLRNCTRITEAGLECLEHLPSLNSLNVTDTFLNDLSLPYLRGISSLKNLNLDGTVISNDGYRELQKALPNAKITWSLYRYH